jgi:hypothetical protein
MQGYDPADIVRVRDVKYFSIQKVFFFVPEQLTAALIAVDNIAFFVIGHDRDTGQFDKVPVLFLGFAQNLFNFFPRGDITGYAQYAFFSADQDRKGPDFDGYFVAGLTA